MSYKDEVIDMITSAITDAFNATGGINAGLCDLRNALEKQRESNADAEVILSESALAFAEGCDGEPEKFYCMAFSEDSTEILLPPDASGGVLVCTHDSDLDETLSVRLSNSDAIAMARKLVAIVREQKQWPVYFMI